MRRAFHSPWTVCLEGGSRLCVGREFMSVYESLRDVLTRVHENSSMDCEEGIACARWRVSGQTGMYKSCTSRDVVERSWRQMSGHVGSGRHKSGKVGRNFFFWFLFWLRFCIRFCVSGACSRFWHIFYDAHPLLLQTTGSCRSVGFGGHGVVSGRSRSGYVGSGSDYVGSVSGQSGQSSLFWSLRLNSSTVPRCFIF